jgi:WD40 repeat protein
MQLPEPRLYTNGYTVWSASFSPDSRWFVLAGEEEAEIRDTDSGALLHRLPMHELITDVDISPDGRRVVACGSLGITRVWDAQTGEPVTAELSGPPNHDVQFSHDGRRFLSVTSGSTVTIHETETGRQVGPTLNNGSMGVHAHFTPDDRLVLLTTEHGEVEFWSIPDGRRLERPVRH